MSISVDRSTGEEFCTQAENVGRLLSVFANEWLTTASRISAEGGTADRALDGWRVSNFFRDLEVIPLPAEFVEEFVEGLCQSDRDSALKTFSDLGTKLVSLLKVYAPDVDALADLARGFAGMAPLKKLVIERPDGNSVAVYIVGAGRKFEVTECAFEFLRSILSGYGYVVTSHDLGVGVIRVEARRRGLPPDVAPVPASTWNND
jgi:hypothetical protein